VHSPWQGSYEYANYPEEETKSQHMKNNFYEMVHNPNLSNSDEHDDSDCCKECKKYYCVTKKM
jgi:hypothetical protein